MEKVINLLSEIEEKADEIMKRANEEKLDLHKKLEEDIKQLDNSIAAEKSEKISALQAQINKELAEEQQALINDCNKQLEQMDSQYQHNHDDLVDKIFLSLIQS
jgi:vacuolar-type H+-ATPase subunit E/Vma4